MSETGQVQVESESKTASALRCRKCGAVNKTSNSFCYRCEDQLRILSIAENGTLQPTDNILPEVRYLSRNGWMRDMKPVKVNRR